MTKIRLLRTLVLATVLSLLILAIPAAPAQAASITLSPDKGPPGTTVTVAGASFTAGSLIDIRFDGVSKGFVQLSGTTTSFTKTFDVPQKNPGTYAVQAYDWSGEVAYLLATVVFTVTGVAKITSIDPDKGPVGTEVELSGEGLDSNEDIEVYLDRVDSDYELYIIEGDDESDSSGNFNDTVIEIPDTVAGSHKIIIRGSDSETEAETTFTVQSNITISPESGTSGTKVTVSGSGFGRRRGLEIYFNNAKQTISGDTQTSSDGKFTATFTVPESAPGAFEVRAKDASNNSAKATYTIAGKISLNPVKGNVGAKITVNGTGFKTSSPVIINFDSIQVATATADSTGAFSVDLSAPPSSKGNHTITASDGSNSASGTFEVLTSATLDKPSGNVGTALKISGTGFSGQVTVKYDDTVVATTPADASGAFSASFSVPKSTKGNHNITISDGTNTMTQTFTVESEPPPVPKLLSPEPAGKAKSEANFDWEDSNDPSVPVTYILQIARDKDFTTESIILERKGLTKSEYTLTKEDKLEPTKKDNPYYWRGKAIDAASNESAWSEPRAFYTGFTFSMGGWVLYLLISLGAILVFIFGLWVGRRTAYY